MAKDLMSTQTGGADNSTQSDVAKQSTQTSDLAPKEKKQEQKQEESTKQPQIKPVQQVDNQINQPQDIMTGNEDVVKNSIEQPKTISQQNQKQEIANELSDTNAAKILNQTESSDSDQAIDQIEESAEVKNLKNLGVDRFIDNSKMTMYSPGDLRREIDEAKIEYTPEGSIVKKDEVELDKSYYDYDSENVIPQPEYTPEGGEFYENKSLYQNREMEGSGYRLSPDGKIIEVSEQKDEEKEDGFYTFNGREYIKKNGDWKVKVEGEYIPLSAGDVESRKLALENNSVKVKTPMESGMQAIEKINTPFVDESGLRTISGIPNNKLVEESFNIGREIKEDADIEDYSVRPDMEYEDRYESAFSNDSYLQELKNKGVDKPLSDGLYSNPNKPGFDYIKRNGAWYVNKNPNGEKENVKNQFVPLKYGSIDTIAGLEKNSQPKMTKDEREKSSKEVKASIQAVALDRSKYMYNLAESAGPDVTTDELKSIVGKADGEDPVIDILKKSVNQTLSESEFQVLDAFGSLYNDAKNVIIPTKSGEKFPMSRLFEFNTASPFEYYRADGSMNPLYNEELASSANMITTEMDNAITGNTGLRVWRGWDPDDVSRGIALAQQNVELGKIKAPGFYRLGDKAYRADGFNRWFDEDGGVISDPEILKLLNSGGAANVTGKMKIVIQRTGEKLEEQTLDAASLDDLRYQIKDQSLYKLFAGNQELKDYLFDRMASETAFTSYSLGGENFMSKVALGGFIDDFRLKTYGNLDKTNSFIALGEILLDHDLSKSNFFAENYKDDFIFDLASAQEKLSEVVTDFYKEKEYLMKARNFISHDMGNLTQILTLDQIDGLKKYQELLEEQLQNREELLASKSEDRQLIDSKVRSVSGDKLGMYYYDAEADEYKKRDTKQDVISLKRSILDSYYKEKIATSSDEGQLLNDMGGIDGLVSSTIVGAEEYVNQAGKINKRLQQMKSMDMGLNEYLFSVKTEYLNKIPLVFGSDGKLSESDQLNTSVELFGATKDMTDFILEQQKKRNLTVNEDGSIDINSVGVTEEELKYIQTTLDEYNSTINKYLSERQVALKKSSAEISTEIKNNKIDIRNFNRQINEILSSNKPLDKEKESKIKMLSFAIESLSKANQNNSADLESNMMQTNAILLTKPGELAATVSKNAPAEVCAAILSSMPKDQGLSAKNKFDFLFQGLVDHMETLRKDEDIEFGLLDRASMKIRDMLDWNTLGIDLSSKEKEYLQTLSTVKQLMPLYMNNRASFTKESQGFFESFTQGFYNSFFPNTAPSLGGSFLNTDMTNERETANKTQAILKNAGLTEKDVYGRGLANLQSRGKATTLADSEFWGQQTGLTSAIMGTFMLTRGVPSAAGRALVGTEKLLVGASGMTKSERFYTGVSNIYNNAMNSTRFSRFMKAPISYSAQFELGGQVVGAQEEELDWLPGLIGGVFAEGFVSGFRGVKRMVTGEQAKVYVNGILQEKAPGFLERWGERTARVTGFGVGEMSQEFGEEVAHAWQNSNNGVEFFEEMKNRFGDVNEAMKFCVSTFVMGAGFGLAANSKKASSVYESLNREQREVVDNVINEINEEMAAVQETVDTYLKENIKEDVKSQVASETAVEQQEKQKKDDTKDKQGVPSKVGEEQESIQTEPVAETSQEEAGTDRVVQEEETVAPTEETTTPKEKGSPSSIESERVTLRKKETDNPMVDEYAIYDENGNEIGDVTGQMDSNGNFIVDNINVKEGSQKGQIGTETMTAINDSIEGKVIINPESQNGKVIGQSMEKNGEASVDEDGQYVVGETTEETTEEDTIPNRLRKLKFKDTKRIPPGLNVGLDPEQAGQALKVAWNAAVEVAAKVIEGGGSAIKAISDARSNLRKSKWYQALRTEADKQREMDKVVSAISEQLGTEEFEKAEAITKKARLKAEREFKKGEYYQSLDLAGKRRALKNFRESIIEQALESKRRKPKQERDAAKVFRDKVKEVTGQDKGPMIRIRERELLAKRFKDQKAGAISMGKLKEEVIKYAKEHLPKDKYTKRDVDGVLNQVNKAKSPKTLEKAMEAIDRVVERKTEASRKGYARETQQRVKNINQEITKKKGTRKVGAIPTERQTEVSTFLKGIDADGISSMSTDELAYINDVLDGIINEGKTEQKAVEDASASEIRRQKAKIIQGWSTSNRHSRILNGVDSIREHLKASGATVIINGELMNKSAFEDYMRKMYPKRKAKKETTEEVQETEQAQKEATEEVQEVEETQFGDEFDNVAAYQRRDSKITPTLESPLSKAGRKIKRFTVNSMDDVYTMLQDAYKSSITGSRKANQNLKTFVDDKIVAPMKAAMVNILTDTEEIRKEFHKGLEDAFGSKRKGQRDLRRKELLSPEREQRSKGKKISNDVAVNIYNLMRSEEDGKMSNRDRLIEKNNLSEEALDEIQNHIDNNPSLKQYADWLMENYNVTAKNRYESTYKMYTNQNFPERMYYPEKASRTQEEELEDKVMSNDITIGLNSSTGISNHMKARKGGGPLDWNNSASSVYYQYNNSMAHAKHMFPISKDANLLFSPENEAYMIENMGRDGYLALKDNLKGVLANESRSREALDKFISPIKGFAIISTLAGKPQQIVKQATSSLHYLNAGLKYGLAPSWVYKLAETGTPGAVAGTIAGSLLTPLKIGKASVSKFMSKEEREFAKYVLTSPFVKNRWRGGSIDYDLRKLFNDESGLAWKNFLNKASGLALLTTKLGDMGAIIAAPGGGLAFGVALYNKYRNEGQSVEEATKNAYNAFVTETEETQQTTRRDLVTGMQSTALFRMIGTYKSSQSAMAKKTIKAYKNLRSGAKLSPEEKVQAMYDIIYYPIFGSMVFATVANGAAKYLYKPTGDDDEEDHEAKKRIIYDGIMDGFQGTIQGFGVTGMAADHILNYLRGRPYFANNPVGKTYIKGVEAASNTIRNVLEREEPKKRYGELSKKERGEFLAEMEKQGKSPRTWGEAEELYKTWQPPGESIKEILKDNMLTKNFVEAYDNFAEWYRGNKDIDAAVMDWESESEVRERLEGARETDALFPYIMKITEKLGITRNPDWQKKEFDKPKTKKQTKQDVEIEIDPTMKTTLNTEIDLKP